MDPSRSARKTLKSFVRTFPLILGILLLVSLFIAAIPPEVYVSIFSGNFLLDPFIGAVIGSISGGNPVTSYVIGGELLSLHVSLAAVTAFILAWVTVGFIQLPAEADILGSRFALVRNITSFIFAMLVSACVVATMAFLEGII